MIMAPYEESNASVSPLNSALTAPYSADRRGSIASILLPAQLDKTSLATTLDEIHSNASRSEKLTSFNELAPARSLLPGQEERSLAGQLVQGGISSILNRLTPSASNGKDTQRPSSAPSNDKPVAANSTRANSSTNASKSLQTPESPSPSNSSRRFSPSELKSPSHALEASSRRQSDEQSPPVSAESSTYASKRGGVSRSIRGSISETSTASPSTFDDEAGPKAKSTARSYTPKRLSLDHRSHTMHSATNSPTGSLVSKDFVDPYYPQPPARLNVNVIPIRSGMQNGFQDGRDISSSAKKPEKISTKMQTSSASYVTGDHASTTPSDRIEQIANKFGPVSSSHSSHPDPDTHHIKKSSKLNGDERSIPGPSPSPVLTKKSQPANLVKQMRRKILSRDFWMKDENAKVCFHCGDSFSTFRRKHHCRLCGQIYCGSCTDLISGKPFGQASKLRVCKTCETMLHGDDSSDYSEDENPSSLQSKQIRFSDSHIVSGGEAQGSVTIDASSSAERFQNHNSGNAPRKSQETRTSMTGFPTFEPHSILSRPNSSRSVRSLRPRSSSLRQSRPRHQHMRSLNIATVDEAPFQSRFSHQFSNSRPLSAFHTDSIIDPDLAPFMSDDSSENETPSILSKLNGSASNLSDLNHGSPTGSSRKSASKSLGRRLLEPRLASMDADNISISSARNPIRPHMKTRTLSSGSLTRYGSSGRIIRSDNLFKSSEDLLAITRNQLGSGNLVSSEDEPHRKAETANSGAAFVELNQTCLQYVKKLLRQFLDDANIRHPKNWAKTLMPILLLCAGSINLDVHRGDDIDIRHYVKLKKAPGGLPHDSNYVSGVVFTKNVAVKGMRRSIKNPRILLISFPVEYARQEPHFMSLDPVIAQEREYLKNIVRRIAALRPSVLIVHRQVSGIALQFLKDANIAVICNVKLSVLQAVSRCTQTRIITSVDKLTMDLSLLGKCDLFEVRTFVHQGVKKSYIYLSGCQRDLGCTIVLRGGDRKALGKLKKITEFMCYVTYNIKLESSLMRDQFLFMPTTIEPPRRKKETDLSLQNSDARKDGSPILSEPHTDALDSAHSRSEHDVDTASRIQTHNSINSEEAPMQEGVVPKSMYEEFQTRLLSISPFVQLAEPFVITKCREEEQKMVRIAKLQYERQEYLAANPSVPYDPSRPDFQLVQPEMVYASVQNRTTQVQEIVKAIHKAEYEKSSQLHTSLKRRWDAYIAGQADPFSPFTHQRIILLFSIVSTPTSDACEGPDLLGLDFYREHDISEGQEPDIPLGEYVERLCNQADSPCVAHQCERKMLDHHRQYVHGYGQVSVHVQKLQSRIRGIENTILMWSKCRKCDSETQITPMSSDTWKYSFGKYLELTFWSKPLHPRAGDCSHDVHRQHTKYFGFKNLAVRFDFEPIQLIEVTTPRATITWKVEDDLRLKNEQFEKIEEVTNRYFHSVRTRIKSINVDAISPTDVEACKAEVESMAQQLEAEQSAMIQKLREKYAGSKYYEIIPLNRAIRLMQEKVADWDVKFADFERNYFPSERDIRRLAALQLKKVFLDDEDTVSNTNDVEEKAHQALHEDSMSDSPLNEKSVTRPTSPQAALTNEAEKYEQQLVERLDLAIPEESLPQYAVENSSEAGETASIERFSQPKPVTEIHPNTSPTRVDATPVSPTGDPDPNHKSRTDKQTSGLPKLSSDRRSPSLVRSRTQPTITTHAYGLHRNTEGAFIIPQLPRPVKGNKFTSANPTSSANSVQQEKENVAEVSNNNSNSDINEKLLVSPIRASRSSMPSRLPRAINKHRDSKVSELAKHFEQMSREFEKERLRERRQRAAKTFQSRAYPVAVSKPIVEVFKDATEAVKERETSYVTPETDKQQDGAGQSPDEQLSAASPKAQEDILAPPDTDMNRDGAKTSGEGAEEVDTASSSYAASEAEVVSDTDDVTRDFAVLEDTAREKRIEAGTEASVDIPKHEKSSLLKMLTSFWSERSASAWLPLEYPLMPTDHIFADSDVIVREDEPSSLIAFSLASQDYVSKMKQYNERAQSLADLQRLQTQAALDDPNDASTERVMLGNTATHMRYQFQSGSSRMQCKIFYAEAFEAMRHKCGVSERFVESLSRCVKWESKGGKTKSLFLKTLDERLIMKSLSPVEVQAFLRFAPDYFDYMSKCLFHGLPSTLAKIIGIFQVVIKNPNTGTDFSYFLQVMENVLYEGAPDRMFDLKGSMRNRKIQSTGEKDEVLLDENLLDYISQWPVYVRHHSSSMLTSSISNDTLFCSKQNVMDYSLIVGLYDDRRELIVGIIDYIRTYTWDKKLESWIKDRGKHKPTVRSPKDYRNRFRASIPRYFPLAPSCWQVFGVQGMLPSASSGQARRSIDEDAVVDDSADEAAVKSDGET